MTEPEPSTFTRLSAAGPAAIALLEIEGEIERFERRHLRAPDGAAPLPMLPNPGEVRRATLCDAEGAAVDDILLSRHGRKLRLHLHGSPGIVQAVVNWLRDLGFTERGPGLDLWPADDLLAAEAYSCLPNVRTDRGLDWLRAQPERLRAMLQSIANARLSGNAAIAAIDDAIGRHASYHWFTTPTRIALVGPPNVGKSTLMNALTDRPTSIVSATPGATRDYVEAEGTAEGFPVTWVDTAGLRTTEDALEAAGIERTREIAQTCEVCVFLLDATRHETTAMETVANAVAELPPAVVAWNKCDLVSNPDRLAPMPGGLLRWTVSTSAARRQGLRALTGRLIARLGREESQLDGPATFTNRQRASLKALRRILGTESASSTTIQAAISRVIGRQEPARR